MCTYVSLRRCLYSPIHTPYLVHPSTYLSYTRCLYTPGMSSLYTCSFPAACPLSTQGRARNHCVQPPIHPRRHIHILIYKQIHGEDRNVSLTIDIISLEIWRRRRRRKNRRLPSPDCCSFSTAFFFFFLSKKIMSIFLTPPVKNLS